MGFIEVNGLSKSYQQAGQEIVILSDLDLVVERGETVAILGQSGSGKSTLLTLLAGLDKPSLGTISVGKHAVHQMNERELSRMRSETYGIIFQQFHLLGHLTARENVAIPLEIRQDPAAITKATAALDQVALGHRCEHYPSQLSGGEQQRVAIARAFVGHPSLILADEPSGNLDQETGSMVMDLLFSMVSENQMTLLLVTHDSILAGKCQRRYFLKNGFLEKQ